MNDQYKVAFVICTLGILFTLQGILIPVWQQCMIITLCALLAALFGHKVWIILFTLPRDMSYLWRMWMVIRMNRQMKHNNVTPVSLLSAQAASTPEKTCLIFCNRTWTYFEVNQYTWRVANLFSQRGLRHGDVVALMCTNRPEFVATWLGLSRLGVITALINTNLRQDALKHSLKVANPRAVIASSGLCQAILEVRDVLTKECLLLRLCGADQPEQELVPETEFSPLDQELRDTCSSPIEGLPAPNYRDKLLYIYTSGTTGFPKAAVLLNSRYLFATVAAMKMLPLHSDDRIYNPLPLYHSAGGIVGVGPALCYGIPSFLRDKFSASSYWKDCAQHGCTVGQYIGEMCRYMLAVPSSDSDQAHNVRILIGNGLRSAIWETFVKRFNVKQIVELYGATEGNTNIVNVDGTVGAVGFLPNILPHKFFPIGLVKIDDDTGELMRSGPENLCVRCKPGEPGMFVGKIEEGDATREFHGYLDRSASSKKIARDVFSPGDKAFLSGDILVMDEKGYLYFKDRTGDTFRWKGENVATAEVEAAISNAVGLRDACVYGVEVPGSEGRAGMAAILDPEHVLDLNSLAKALHNALPTYAQPLFLRVAEKIDLTGTYKLKKTELQKEGFDPEKVKDRLYVLAGNKGEYQELTSQLFNKIMSGHIRV